MRQVKPGDIYVAKAPKSDASIKYIDMLLSRSDNVPSEWSVLRLYNSCEPVDFCAGRIYTRSISSFEKTRIYAGLNMYDIMGSESIHDALIAKLIEQG